MKLLTPITRAASRHSTEILLAIIVIFAGASMVMTVSESVSTKQVALSTKKIALDTHNTVEGETTILTAIKQAELDNKLTATQKTNIVICMLQVPQEDRIPKENDCRKQAVNSDTSNKTSQGTSAVDSKTSSVSSSSHNAPKSTTTQGNTSQGNGSPTPPTTTPPLINLFSPLQNTCIKVKPIFSVC